MAYFTPSGFLVFQKKILCANTSQAIRIMPNILDSLISLFLDFTGEQQIAFLKLRF